MINKVLNNLAKSHKIKLNDKAFSCDNQVQMINYRIDRVEMHSYCTTLKYFFARKVSSVPKPQQLTTQQAQPNIFQPSSQHPPQTKTYIPKQTENYTFIQLDNDLQMYQTYLNIFNTHSKKAHEKLLKNEIKIIECIISSKRDDLLTKFLSTNYRNRLANPQTLKKIASYYRERMNARFDEIIGSRVECQAMLETIALLTEYNEMQVFDQFMALCERKLRTAGQDSLLKTLEILPSQECQFLIIYNSLIKQKQLPQQLMQSKYFEMTTENLNFHNLGEAFYDIRKFLRRYFAIYSKKIQEQLKNEEKQEKLKTFQRQFKKTSQSSLIENDVLCFLKTLRYENVRSEIQIDGFVVDFVIDGVRSKVKGKQQPLSVQVPSTILQVMGSYHYTSDGRLKAKDLRKFILLGSKYRQKKYNIKLIHYDDYNKSKGHRNKMELIRNLLEFTNDNINWQPKNQGYDSRWQLKETYDEFK